MPDVFHVISDMGIGGAGIFLSHLLSSPLKNTGSLAVLPQGSLLCSRFLSEDIPFIALPLSGEQSFSLGDVRELRSLFRREKNVLVVSHASLSARVAAKSLCLPAISVRHCDTPPPMRSLRLYNILTDATVATSFSLGCHMRQAGVKNVHVIENGHTPMGIPTPKERKEAKAHFSLPNDRIAIGLCGRLAPVKGHKTAIDALAQLGKEKRRFMLCFLGTGEEEARLRAQARDLNVEKEVRFLGFSHDVRTFYHAMDAHISCSHNSETSSLSLAEGLSAGCVTISTDIEGNRARVGDGGLFFPPEDAAALASLFRLIACEKSRAALAARAALRARSLPTWQDTQTAYSALFAAFLPEFP